MTEGNYKFLTAEQFAHAIAVAPTNTIFDFTIYIENAERIFQFRRLVDIKRRNLKQWTKLI